jgi:hypothetical protein
VLSLTTVSHVRPSPKRIVVEPKALERGMACGPVYSSGVGMIEYVVAHPARVNAARMGISARGRLDRPAIE